MRTVYDVQQLLRRFGVIVYTGDRSSDISLMKLELRDLYQNKMIDVRTFQQAIHVLHADIET